MQVFHLLIGLYHIIERCRQLSVPDEGVFLPHIDVEQELPEVLPPLEESLTLVTEQLVLHPPIEDSSLVQEIPQQEYCKLQILDVDLPTPYPLDIQCICSCTPPVVIHDQALAEFITGEDQCLNSLIKT